MTKKDFKIALVGVEFEENLSLRYLAGALLAEGYETVSVLPYNSLSFAGEIADAILNENFDLVGISMAFQVRAIDDMVLVQLLRQRGFQNHITAGGQFATLHYNEIFKDCAGLNSIIRFEAEASIVALTEVLRQSQNLEEVPGLVWKDPSQNLHVNAAIPSPGDINDLPLPLRRTNRQEVLGLKTVQMVGSRGCHATCKYCCVSALATERRAASKDAGGLTALPGTRRRTAKSIAEEIALLYFKHDIRIFEFQDDNWIHPKAELAVVYFKELKDELDRLAVGQIGLTLKTRADSVQPEVLKILKELGLIRVFVGIESGTQNLLSKLGRKSRDNVSLQALQHLRDFKIPAYFNALLFGPDVRFEELEPELAFLEDCADFPFEIVEVVIYGKTGLYISLSAEDRLRGNYLDYEYSYRDKLTQDIYGLISQLDTRHFGVYSPIKMAADLGFNLGVAQVFYPGPFTEELALRVAELNKKINLDQVRVIRAATALVMAGVPFEEAKEQLITETISQDLNFYTEIISLQNEIENYVRTLSDQKEVNSYYRVGALVQSGLIAGLFLLLSSGLQAQPRDPFDSILKKRLIDLVYNPDPKAERAIKKQLAAQKQPVHIYMQETWNEMNVRNPGMSSMAGNYARDNYLRLNKDVNKITRKRMKADYERLNHLLRESNPKIKIASSLVFMLDVDGKVIDVSFSGYKTKNILTPELKQIILNLLSEKQFYTYENEGVMVKPRTSFIFHRHKKRRKQMRRGPLD